MKKALAQNPNMLRTMIGLGLTLIVILSYAVYGATIDSSYYMYHTSNEGVGHDPIDQGLSEDNTTQQWTFTTNRATTSLNVTIDGVEQDDTLTLIQQKLHIFSFSSYRSERPQPFSYYFEHFWQY